MEKKVTIYSKPGCGQCMFTKKYLDKSKVSYFEKNISENPDWAEEVKALGFQTLPVIVIEGEELLARAICHEVDHLDGVLYRDVADGPVHDVDQE